MASEVITCDASAVCTVSTEVLRKRWVALLAMGGSSQSGGPTVPCTPPCFVGQYPHSPSVCRPPSTWVSAPSRPGDASGLPRPPVGDGAGHGRRDRAARRRRGTPPHRGHPDHPAGRAAGTAGQHQPEEGLRPRSVRCLHRAARRSAPAELPGPGGRPRRRGGDHRRRAGAGRRTAPGPAGVHRRRRLPVRLLHARAGLLGGRRARRGRPRLAQPRQRGPDGGPAAELRRGRRADERQPVPLRRVRQHRARGPTGGGRAGMKPFAFARPGDVAEAVRTVAAEPEAVFLAGGTNLVDHLRLGVARPDLVVDVRTLTSREVSDLPDGGLRLGAASTNSQVAADRRVRERYPVLAQALLAGATGQLRNAATTAGNPLQRTRCVYFQDVTTPCNKREPGSGCSAVGGYTRYHAVLGVPAALPDPTAPETCIATHPSDMAVALAALDAQVQVLGPAGERTVPFAELHRLPGDDPSRDTTLEHGELITAVDLPALPAGTRSAYRKVRDRASYAFALVSVAAVAAVEDGRIALGGVAHKPWRATRAEEILHGGTLTEHAVRAAMDAELAAAQPQPGTGGGNGFKIPLVSRTVGDTLRELRETRS